MELGAVALVPLEMILGILLRHLQHIPVTSDLGKDRRSRDVRAFCVALYDAAAVNLYRAAAVAVNKRKLRLRLKLRDCPGFPR